MAIPSHYDALSALELVAIALLDVKGDWTWAALEALRKRDREELFAAAEQLLRSPSTRERARGAVLLAQAAGHDAEEHRERRARCAEALLAALPTEQAPPVLKAMGYTLGYLEDARALPALRALKDHPDARVREGVARGLMPHHHDSVALQTLMELSRDGDTSVREEVLSGLALKDEGEVDTPALRDAFLDRVSDEDSGIRADALVGLARRKDPRVLVHLRHELERPPVEIAAIEAARYLEDASLLPLLLAVREAARPMDDAFEGAIDFAIECLGGHAS
ncbi:HEAT repeat domain-containing protein [Corallococcus exiguus]|uniref:HEAT repeat domain-containing protein n=1 Tax=Corallococcus exiguus TaxID=83462 RepID=UPI001A8DD490|nr:HEAT repeat domain-containing protein [Corallococcus exiguus]MBN8465359.1 HEAT repeat domain-containing protein [Corallococcus exiguus]